MYSRFLVPLDGSQLAESVLPVVERLATCGHATVLLLHVVERGAPDAVHGEHHLQGVEEAKPYLNDLAGRLRTQGIAVETHAHSVPEGDVARSIADHSAEHAADLIVLCTHGRGNFRDILFGRIAQQVLRRGEVPVLLIRPNDMSLADRFEPEVVLVPLDGSSPAEAALEPALDLARLCEAGLRLVTVVPTQETLRGDRQAVGTLLPAATRAALDLEEGNAYSYVDAVTSRLHGRSLRVPITAEVLRGDIGATLSGAATAPDVGLVVMSTHGHAGLQAMWGGSVAAHLLGRIHAPILLIRTP